MSDDTDTDSSVQTEKERGTTRLVRALRRPSRGQAIVGILLALLGFAAAVQIRLTHTRNDFAGQRRADLVELLDSLSGAADRAEQQIQDLRQTRTKLRSSSRAHAAAKEEAQTKLHTLAILAGTVAAKGPGITVTINDPGSKVTAVALLNGIEELRDAGAEAIAINQKVRVVASTYFTDKDGELYVDGTAIDPPYVIDAIGSSHTLSQAVKFPGGLADEVNAQGGTVTVKEADQVIIKALHTLEPAQYAQPTDR